MNLQLSPELVTTLNAMTRQKLAPASMIRPLTRRQKPFALGRDRRRSIVARIIEMMRPAEPTPFSMEGSCRAGIRSSLCMQGVAWSSADVVAADIVATALDIVGATRPSWNEGQPEWTQPGALPILRERCVRCGHDLPEGHRLFCSDPCAAASKMDRQRQRWDEEAYAKWKAGAAAWTKRQPARVCEACSDKFQPNRKVQRFCSYHCAITDRKRTA